MNKTIATTLVAVLTVIQATEAKVRTWKEKQSIATQTMATRGQALTQADEILYTTQTLTVIGKQSGGGYVIVSNDDTVQPLLGYSHNGNYQDDLPNGLKWWIDQVDETLKAGTRGMTAQDILQGNSTYAKTVEPLVTSTWNQNSPYNALCPAMSSRGNYPTGCVATAMAQIMYYYKYPEQGQGANSYVFRPSDGTAYQLSANFSEATYDWENMLDSYRVTGTTEEQRQAVATLMSHCGISVNMSYNPEGSGAYSVEAANAMRNFFGYNTNIRLCRRTIYSAELWMDILFGELNEKRPVYYAGADKNNGGHAFVVDGYDKNGLVHVNWGWGGNSDGYYDIALLNPPRYNFSEGQEMIVGICRPEIELQRTLELTAEPLAINIYGTETKRLTVTGKVYNLGVDEFKGTIAAIIQNDDTTIVAKKQEDVALSPANLGFLKPTDVAFRSIDITEIPNGDYRVYMGAQNGDDDTWHLVKSYDGKANSYLITKEGNEISVTPVTEDMWTKKATGIKNPCRQTVTGKVYDLQGREAAPASKGVYIKDGKKILF